MATKIDTALDLSLLLSDQRILVCRACKAGVVPQYLVTHIRAHHRRLYPEFATKRSTTEWVKDRLLMSLPCELLGPSAESIPVPLPETKAFPVLKLHVGYGCTHYSIVSKREEDKQKTLIKQRQRIGDEFDAFIQQIPIDTADQIAWWLEDNKQRTFPQLSRMAVTVLSAPATSAESERVFSLTLRMLSWDRLRLASAAIEQIECQRSWIKQGFVSMCHESDAGSSDDSDGCSDGAEHDGGEEV